MDWSYREDLQTLFGQDELEYVHTTWDNVGIQYGLRAFQQGKIDFDEFIHINREIGAWRSQSEMQEEWFWAPRNNQSAGDYTRLYPVYSNGRIAAGVLWAGSTFKCYLQSSNKAEARGMYGDRVTKQKIQKIQELQETFPAGVCNYTLGDAGRPEVLLQRRTRQLDR